MVMVVVVVVVNNASPEIGKIVETVVATVALVAAVVTEAVEAETGTTVDHVATPTETVDHVPTEMTKAAEIVAQGVQPVAMMEVAADLVRLADARSKPESRNL
jgi:hypothetical protein